VSEFGGVFTKTWSRGIKIRCDRGRSTSPMRVDPEAEWLGMTLTPSSVGEPECNGVMERFIRTLKEQCFYLHRFETLERRGG